MICGESRALAALVLSLVGFAARAGEAVIEFDDPPRPSVPVGFALPAPDPRAAPRRDPTDRLTNPVSNAWDGVDELAVSPTSLLKPPDPFLAVGPGLGSAGRVIQVTNKGVQLWNKSGTSLAGPVSPASFFGSGSGTTDPKIIFDRQSDRFFAVVQDGNTTTNSNLYVAVSTSSTPNTLTTSDWTRGSASVITTFSGGTAWFDYPGLGSDQTRLVVTGNMFSAAGNSIGTKIRVFSKAALLAGTFSTFTDINVDAASLSGAFGIMPAHVAGPRADGQLLSDNGNFYLINRGGQTSYRLWELSGTPPSTVSVVQNALRTWSAGAPLTAGAPQSGTTIRIDTLSPRVQNAVYRFGMVTCCLTSDFVTLDSAAGEVFWAKIRTNGGSPTAPTVSQSGGINPSGSTEWAYQPACAVNTYGETCFVYCESSSAKFVEIRYTIRAYNGATGTVQTPVVAKTSVGFYDDFLTTNPERWGDYAGCCEDPTDNSFWMTHEYCRSAVTGAGNDARWGTWVFRTAGTTGVQVTEFAANDGRCTWTTGLEVRNLGFHLYREEGDRKVRITPALVAGTALATFSEGPRAHRYAFDDPEGGAGTYWLEAVDTSGGSTWHGPYRGGGLPPERTGFLTASPLLTDLGRAGSGPRALSERAESGPVRRVDALEPTGPRIATQRWLASRDAVKISVRTEGWYEVSAERLFAAGLEPGTDPRTLRLFANGREVACMIRGEADARLDPGDLVEFYGLGVDTPSTDAQVYWLTAGSGRGRRIVAAPAVSGGSPVDNAPVSVEYRPRTIYFPGALNGERENFFGEVIAGSPITVPLDVPDPVPFGTRAHLEVLLQGVTDRPDPDPDHHLTVEINGVPLGEMVFDGTRSGYLAVDLPADVLRAGPNEVTLATVGPWLDVSLVDTVRLSYRRLLRLDGESLRFPARPGSRLRLDPSSRPGGLRSRFFDVTDAADVMALSVRPGPGESIYLSAPGGTAVGYDRRLILAVPEEAILTPASVEPNVPSSLAAVRRPPDYVILGPEGFREATASLAAFQESRRMRTRFVALEDVYDEFSFGRKSPAALRDLLALWRRRGASGPRFLLLVGDATFDPRGYMSDPSADLVPTRLIDTAYLETASDDWFGDFNEDGVPELAIGRLPVRSPEEAAELSARLAAQPATAISRGALLISDFPDVHDFPGTNQAVRALLPAGTPVAEIRRPTLESVNLGPATVAALSAGPAVVNYAGHGTITGWRGSMSTDEIAGLSNGAHRSVFTVMNCLNGYFQDPVLPCLAEELLRNPGGGAVAVWASSGTCLPADQAIMDVAFYAHLFGGARPIWSPARGDVMTIGEAAARAKAAIRDPDVRRTWILFGDPAARVR